MKKVLCSLSLILITLCNFTGIFAESGETVITLNIAETYKITIPADIEIIQYRNVNYIGDIKASEINLLPNRKLKVDISCNNKLTSPSGNTINYLLTDGTSEVESKTFTTDETIGLYIEIDNNSWDNLKADKYSDTLTFNWYIE